MAELAFPLMVVAIASGVSLLCTVLLLRTQKVSRDTAACFDRIERVGFRRSASSRNQTTAVQMKPRAVSNVKVLCAAQSFAPDLWSCSKVCATIIMFDTFGGWARASLHVYGGVCRSIIRMSIHTQFLSLYAACALRCTSRHQTSLGHRLGGSLLYVRFAQSPHLS